MQFPRDKANALIKTHEVNEGFKANTATFPNPPNKTEDMDADFTAREAKQAEIVAAKAVLTGLEDEEDEIYQRIIRKSKRNINYGESVADGNEATLALIAWGNPKARTPMQPPGQPRVLEIIGQGDGWLQADWKEPVDGGKVASYTMQRSGDGGTKWEDAGTFTASEAILLNQPKGEKLIYQVIAQNKAGVSMASNTISLVL